QACVIVYILSRTMIIPCDFQLQACLVILNGCDSVITTGTGSGKTLCILIPLLL
ncbi:hypothetical protein PAXRUDRAFT_49542, partial [Paxillus rubicundulus Ve08.2h10]